MHHFAIVLIEPTHDPVAEVERLLAPFSEGLCEESESEDPDTDHWWDWYRIGGRWDGIVRGVDRAEVCAACKVDHDCHYSEEHEQVLHNAIGVVEMGECRPYTLVTPEGAFRHRQMWIGAQDKEWWPWDLVDDPGYDRWVIEQLLAHSECIAVGVDYHS